MDKTVPIERFVKEVKGERLSVAGGEGTLCAVFVETDDSTGFARRVAPVRLGGRLAETVPDEDFSWGDGRRRWRGSARPPRAGSRSAGSSPRPAGGCPRGRSEERRVGQECFSTCRIRRSPAHYK